MEKVSTLALWETTAWQVESRKKVLVTDAICMLLHLEMAPDVLSIIKCIAEVFATQTPFWNEYLLLYTNCILTVYSVTYLKYLFKRLAQICCGGTFTQLCRGRILLETLHCAPSTVEKPPLQSGLATALPACQSWSKTSNKCNIKQPQLGKRYTWMWIAKSTDDVYCLTICKLQC